MISTYEAFILKNPPYGLLPYTELDIRDKLEEVEIAFPQIATCLPLVTHPLATYYAIRYLYEIEDSESPVPIRNVASRNDQITYALAGDGNILNNTIWGTKLNRLFRIYGCFNRSAKNLTRPCC